LLGGRRGRCFGNPKPQKKERTRFRGKEGKKRGGVGYLEEEKEGPIRGRSSQKV